MRLALIALAAAFATAAAAAPCTGPLPPPGARFTGEVTRVLSGDSICVGAQPGAIPVRLAGFAACRTEATRLNLVKIVGGKRVLCTVAHRAGTRVSARCTVEGHSVVEVLRRAGTCERR